MLADTAQTLSVCGCFLYEEKKKKPSFPGRKLGTTPTCKREAEKEKLTLLLLIFVPACGNVSNTGRRNCNAM